MNEIIFLKIILFNYKDVFNYTTKKKKKGNVGIWNINYDIVGLGNNYIGTYVHLPT